MRMRFFLSYSSLVGIGGIFRANIIRSWAAVVNKGWQVGEIKSTENNLGQRQFLKSDYKDI